MPSIFLSYSRRDTPAVQDLKEKLVALKHEVWVDVADLPEASLFRDEIAVAIERSDIFLLAASQNSLQSVEVRKEFELARNLGKRIIPVSIDGVQPSAAPPDMANINWIPLADTRAFERINKAIGTDLVHLRKHTRFLIDARSGTTLRGKTLRDAQQWLAASTSKEPAPVDDHRKLVADSLRAQRQRRIAAAVGAIAIIAVVVYLSTISRTNRRNARANALAEESEQLWSLRQRDQSMLRAVAAYQTAVTSASQRALVHAAQRDPHLEMLLHAPVPEVDALAFDPRTGHLASAGNAITLWKGAAAQISARLGVRVSALTYAADGAFLISGDWNGLVRRWHAEAGNEVAPPLDAKRGLVESMSLHPGNRWLAVSYANGAMLWDLERSTATPLLDTTRRSSAVTFSSTGETLIAVEGTQTLMAWDFADGVMTNHRSQSFAGITAVAMHGRIITAGLSDGTLLRLYADDLSELRSTKGHDGPILALAVDPEDGLLASAGADKRARVWRDDELLVDFTTAGRVFAVAFDSTSSRLAVAGAEPTIYLLDAGHRQPLAQVVQRKRNGIQQVAFDARGGIVASVDDLHFPDVKGVKLAQLMDFARSPDGKLLAVADNEGTIGIWDARSQAFIRSWKTPEAVADVTFSPDSKRMASVNSANGEISLINIGRKEISTFEGTCKRVFSVAFIGDQLVTGCDDGGLELLDLDERKSIALVPDHEQTDEPKFVNALAVNGSRVAAGTDDGRVVLWNLDPQWWMRRTCRRANRNIAPCNALSGPPAEIPSSTPPPDRKVIPDDRGLPSTVAGLTRPVPRRAPRRR